MRGREDRRRESEAGWRGRGGEAGEEEIREGEE